MQPLAQAALAAAITIFAAVTGALAAMPQEKVLYTFTYGNDGGSPTAGLIEISGSFYGTTAYGGSAFAGSGHGTVFKLTPPTTQGGRWTEEVIYTFQGGSDGSTPIGVLNTDASGALYGTTSYGGIDCNGNHTGCGTVFQLTPPAAQGLPWTEEVLYRFQGGTDGINPVAGIVMDASGALYGTTQFGGIPGNVSSFGTVYKLTPPLHSGHPWQEQVIHTFLNNGDPIGLLPIGGLTIDASGVLFGTTYIGGVAGGAVYKLTPPSTNGGSWAAETMYSFQGGDDGLNSYAGVIIDASGALYGTTELGGRSGYGTVFKVTPPGAPGEAWTEQVLYSFKGGKDGSAPLAPVAFDSSGALYGTTWTGGGSSNVNCSHPPMGAIGCGTVFKLTPPAAQGGRWTEQVLHRFDWKDGDLPQGGPLFDAAGNGYGTTWGGGAHEAGNVFEIKK